MKEEAAKHGAKLIAPRFAPEEGAALMAMSAYDPDFCARGAEFTDDLMD